MFQWSQLYTLWVGLHGGHQSVLSVTKLTFLSLGKFGQVRGGLPYKGGGSLLTELGSSLLAATEACHSCYCLYNYVYSGSGGGSLVK